MKIKREVKFLAVLCGIAFLLGGAFLIGRAHGTNYFRENYAKKYAHELQEIFGKGLQIGEKERKEQEAGECDCGYHWNRVVYDTWNITYTDSEGDTYTAVLDNRTSIGDQQVSWLCSQVEKHFTRKYITDSYDVKQWPEKRRSCDASLDDEIAVEFSDYEDFRTYDETLAERLNQGTSMLRLHELTYAQMFERYPLLITMGFSLHNEVPQGTETEGYERGAEEHIQATMRQVNRDMKNNCNLDVSIQYEKEGHTFVDGEERWCYSLRHGKIKVEKE